MPLTDAKCRTIKPEGSARKHADGEGLYLLVNPNGSKLWRLAYRFEGKQKTLAFGAYPAISLAEARDKKLQAKNALANGFDPAMRKISGDESTFREVSEHWFSVNRENWVPNHEKRVRSILENHIYPYYGEERIGTVQPKTVIKAIRIAEDKGLGETVRRMRQITSAVFGYAIAAGDVDRDPAASLKAAIKKKRKVVHMAKLRPDELPEFYAKMATYDGEPITMIALEFAMHTWARTKEVRFARWAEVKGDTWEIPADRMKMGRGHSVPLTDQSKRILDLAAKLQLSGQWVFPGVRGAMSENTMLYALYRMGYHSRATVHGMRGLASTYANESGLWRHDVVERQLAHEDGDQVRAAYNSAEYWPERVRLMTWWSNFLDGQKQLGELLG